MTTTLIALLAMNALALAAVVVIYRRAKKARKQRVVEAPNSEYRSKYVEDLESKERWERIDLSLLHEVNREEAERILRKLQAVSARGLSDYERSFLDRLVEAERRTRRGLRHERLARGGDPTPAHG